MCEAAEVACQGRDEEEEESLVRLWAGQTAVEVVGAAGLARPASERGSARARFGGFRIARPAGAWRAKVKGSSPRA